MCRVTCRVFIESQHSRVRRVVSDERQGLADDRWIENRSKPGWELKIVSDQQQRRSVTEQGMTSAGELGQSVQGIGDTAGHWDDSAEPHVPVPPVGSSCELQLCWWQGPVPAAWLLWGAQLAP